MKLRRAISLQLAMLALGCHSRFPQGTFDPFVDDWYSKQLRAAYEKPLRPSGQDSVEVYRFTWIPSFHPTTTVRLVRKANEYRLIATRLSGAGGYRPGHAILSKSLVLPRHQGEQVLAWISEMEFWSMPTEEPDKLTEDGHLVLGADGAEWLLEGADQHRYHAVTRWFHDEYPKFEQACVCLIVWSGLKASLGDMEFYRFDPKRLSACSKETPDHNQGAG